MRIHPEGVEVLKWFGLGALIIFLFVLRFSDILPSVFGSLLERASTTFPSRKNKRRGRKFKLSHRTKIRQKFAFWTLCGALISFLLAEWFFVPVEYQVERVLLLPIACAAFSGGSIIIGMGPIPDEQGSRWRRWPFWVTTVTTSGTAFVIARLLNPQTPRAVAGVLVLSLLPFVWIASFMEYVDERLIETEEMGLSKDYDGTTPPVAAPATSSPSKSRHR